MRPCRSVSTLRPSSVQNSFERPRKESMVSIADYIDIDRLIGEIKIKPMRKNYSPYINSISQALISLSTNECIRDQVTAIELLLKSIDKKLKEEDSKERIKASNKCLEREKEKVLRQRKETNQAQQVKNGNQSVKKKQTLKESAIKNLSPIKQFDESSRILYSNFSLSDFKDKDQEVQKLNRQIDALEKILQNKNSGQAKQNIKDSKISKKNIIHNYNQKKNLNSQNYYQKFSYLRD